MRGPCVWQGLLMMRHALAELDADQLSLELRLDGED